MITAGSIVSGNPGKSYTVGHDGDTGLDVRRIGNATSARTGWPHQHDISISSPVNSFSGAVAEVVVANSPSL